MSHAKRQNGFILMPVVIAIALIATIAFMLNNQSTINVDETGDMQVAEQVENIAHAALAHATWGAQNSGCAGDMSMTTVPFGQSSTGSYTATVITPGGATTAYPNLAADQDAWFRSDNITTNNGTTATYHLRMESGNLEYVVVRFDLSSLPAGAQINSATVRFYVEATKGHPEGPVTVHRVTADWTETGATWETMGDKFDNALLATIPAQPDAGDVWVEVNLTAQVQAWVNGGEPNYGIMLIPTGEGTYAEYISREGTTSQRPQLDVVVGTGPATPMSITVTGTLTGNPSPANDITRTLTRSNVPANQPGSYTRLQPGAVSGKDAEIWDQAPNNNYGNADETWVSSASNDTTRSLLRFNMAAIPVGARVLQAILSLNRQSGSGADQPVSAHRIMNPWSEDAVTWNRRETSTNWDTAGGDFDNIAVATTPVGPVNQRYEWDIMPLVQGWVDGSYPNYGVALVAAIAGMPGERFYTSDHADPSRWPSLSITYACECGSTCMAPQGSGSILMVVSDEFWMTPDEITKVALFESWGYTVIPISQWDVSWNFDTLAASSDVVYVSEGVDHTTWGMAPKLAATSLAVINEEGQINDELGIALGFALPVGTAINVTDTSHYITALFSTGPLDIYSAGMEQLTVSGTEAAGLQTLADTGGAGSIVVLDKGAALAGGGTAAGRRVMLPLGTETKFNWDYLTGNGRLLVQRALQWGMETGDVACAAENAADDFETGDYTGGTGSIAWNGDWQEFGESDGPNAGDFMVLANALCTTGQCLQIREDRAQSRQIMRQVDLSGAVSASLSFSYRWRQAGSPTSGSVTLEASGDGGASFTPVKVYTFNTSTAPLVDTVDISAFIGATTQIRFSTSDTAHVTALYVDDLDIVTSCAAAPVLTPLARWKLDETSGTTAVDSVGGHDGTLTNNGPTWDTGQVDGALNFDGSDDYVNVPHDPGLNLTSALTISTWFRADSFGPGTGGYRTFVSKYPNTNTANYWFGTWQDELVFGFWSGGTWYEAFTTGLSLNTDQWYQAAVSFDDASDQVLLYIDGAQVFAGSIAVSPPVNSGAVTIGRSAVGEYWDGRLDDIRIYDEVLTSTDIEELAALGGGGGGGDGDISGYTEILQNWSATTSNNWQTVDLSSFGVPANAVVEVALENKHGSGEFQAGVRAVGSSLERRFPLHEAEQGGIDTVTMHVQTDDSSQIQHYSGSSGFVSFNLLGYWTGATYVERFDAFKAGADASWQGHALGGYGVGPDQVVEIAMSQTSTSIEWLVGARRSGSSLQRQISLHEAEGGGVDMVTLMVASDASSMIEVYAGADSVVDFHLLGYWSTPPGTYSETGGVSGQSTLTATWQTTNLSGFGIPPNSIAQFVMSNKILSRESQMGLRETGSTITSRILDLQEAEGGGGDLGTMHVKVDASSQIQWFAEYGDNEAFFHPVGWWVLP